MFKGGTKDITTDLIHFGARWYDDGTGRWDQQDTFDATLDPDNANRYAYAADDPINNLDLAGLDDLGEWLIAAAASAIGFGIGGCLGRADATFFVAGVGAIADCIAGGVSGFICGLVGGFTTDSLIQLSKE